MSNQKGFLSGVNGMFEHSYTINTILDNAKTYNLPLAMTFIDLKNAFGSVSHKLIQDLLHYVKVPVEIRYYIHNLYANLSAFISTNHWSTELFPINKGVFQGDTLWFLIFLLSFNLIIKLVKSLSGEGFSLHLPIANSEGLPPVGSYFCRME